VLKGYTYTDEVCLEEGAYCTDMDLFGIVSQTGLDNMDGILGLSPQYTSSVSLVW